MTMKVIFTSPRWHLNGINVFTLNLSRKLISRGIDTKILLTQTDRRFHYNDIEIAPPDDLPVEIMNVKIYNNKYWESHWNTLINYLESQAPCIYLPNYDAGHSCISPKLSKNIKIVGIIHSDDPWHYEIASRLGRYWDAIVTVSNKIKKEVSHIDQSFNDRLHVISYGIKVPDKLPIRKYGRNKLKIIYTGRLINHQKKIFDIPKIANVLLNHNIPFNITIIGNGPDESKLKKLCGPFLKNNLIKILGPLPNDEIQNQLIQNDIFILTSEFEGTPISLLEAMANGCIPIATKIESGIPELIKNDINGYLVEVGNISKFGELITKIYNDSELRSRLSREAYSTIRNGEYSIDIMTDRYINLFNHIISKSFRGNYERPMGEIIPPPFIQVSPNIFNSYSWKLATPLRIIEKWITNIF